ncbi:MAG: Zn-ribbon domain-containing OB-fold protein [Candidatus Odinarchaeota archaeon]
MEGEDFSIKQFLKYISEGKLKGLKCSSCNSIIVPPRYKCVQCGSTDFKWVDLSGRGRLLTYTVVHVPPKKFTAEAPYAIGIIQLAEGPRLEARIVNVDVAKHAQTLKTGMEMVFEPSSVGVLAFKPLR